MRKRKTQPFILIAAGALVMLGGSAAIVAASRSGGAGKPAPAASDTDHGGHIGGPADDISLAADFTAESAIVMDIRDYAFTMPNIKIKKGTTVTWVNRDTVPHNAMRAHGESSAAHDAPAPEAVKPRIFAGPLLNQGESYSFTFFESGTNPYHCAPHPTMKGVIHVVD